MNINISNIDRVLILDFGSQTTQLIARRIRELCVYCEVFLFTESIEKLKNFNPHAIILSDGSFSINHDNIPMLPDELLKLNVPILGICYGMQLLVNYFSGKVNSCKFKKFSYTNLYQDGSSELLQKFPAQFEAWISHCDQILELPANFKTTACSKTCSHVVIEDVERKIYGIQIHPEVIYSEKDKDIFKNFIFSIAGLSPNWKIIDFVKQRTQEIKNQVGDGHVLLCLSAGVNSYVAAALVHKSIGKQLTCVFIDHGFNRAGEVQEIERIFGEVFRMDLRIINARDQFFAALEGVLDPEVKYKIIGKVLFDIFRHEALSIDNMEFLGQENFYSDIIEPQSFYNESFYNIKDYYNKSNLLKKMKLKLVEPLKELFKEEVRNIGVALGLPLSLVKQQPFPYSGLAIRIIGEVTEEKCMLLRKADAIVRKEIELAISKGKLSDNLWQWFALLLPTESIGVTEDSSIYNETIIIRCVGSVNGITPEWVEIPKLILGNISNRIMTEVKGVSRVVYDISSKL